jgi:hypothetical protein
LKNPIVSPSGLILPTETELSSVQRVIKIGPYIPKDTFGEGDWVKINYKRFWRPKNKKSSLRDGDEMNETTMDLYIPVETFGENDYLIIDQGDIEYWWPGDKPKVDPEIPFMDLQPNGTTNINAFATTTT